MDQQNKGLFMTNTNDAENIVKADDGAALQGLFASHCDEDGLMTKATLQTDISAIKELLVRTGTVTVYRFDKMQCNAMYCIILYYIGVVIMYNSTQLNSTPLRMTGNWRPSPRRTR